MLLQTTIKSDERPLAAAHSLPGGIRVESEMDGVRYILPARNLGKTSKAGIGFLIFGFVITAFMFLWMSGPIRAGLHSPGHSGWLSICFGLTGLPGLAIGVGLMMVGLAIMRSMGHSEVLVSRDRIWSIECIGPFRLRFKRDINAIVKLVIGDSTIRSRTDGGPWQDLSSQLSLIKVECGGVRPMVMAIAYPTEVVKALAGSLTDSVAALSHRPGAFTVSEEKNIPVVDESGAAGPVDVPVNKPADSMAVVREVDNGFAVVVPPAGLIKGSKGLFFFGLFWNGFMALFTSGMLFGGKSGNTPAPIYLFVTAFWAIGIGLLLAAINMGKRQTILAVIGDTFGVKRTGLFGTREIKLKLDEIAAVRMGQSGMEINNQQVMELQVLGKDGKKKAGLLSERKEDELLWIAWLIRSRTGLKW